MTVPKRDPWRRSRITKAVVDSGKVKDFDEGEALLSAVRLVIAAEVSTIRTPAGQAALLTAVATAYRCFESVGVICDTSITLIRPLPIGCDLGEAIQHLGGHIASEASAATHWISIGSSRRAAGLTVQCWWDGWKAGVLPATESSLVGESWHPLAGIAAGALAVREVFSSALGNRRACRRRSVLSLWEPWADQGEALRGPDSFAFPSAIWMIGLGHLGQGIGWGLSFLPFYSQPLATLQDDQIVGPENEATSLLVSQENIGLPKTRVTANWLEAVGWKTRLIERRHHGDLRPTPQEPGIVFCGLDNPDGRRIIAASGFDWMVDTGVGHGSGDFERLQIKVVAQGQAEGCWPDGETERDIDELLKMPAYKAYEAMPGVCGALPLAAASVAVPFVGAFVGALALATAARIACLQPVCRSIQTELGAPDLITTSDFTTSGRPIACQTLRLKTDAPIDRLEMDAV